MRSPEDFRQQAIKKNIKNWMFRNCSICGIYIGYYFFMYDGHEVIWNGRCDCTSHGTGDEPRTWKEVADLYNLQTSPETIQKFDEFWGFNEPPVKVVAVGSGIYIREDGMVKEITREEWDRRFPGMEPLNVKLE